MGLVSGLLGAPLAPVRLTLALAEQIRRQAEEQFYDPVAIRDQLQEIARRRADGTLDDEAASALEDDLVQRAMEAQTRRGKE